MALGQNPANAQSAPGIPDSLIQLDWGTFDGIDTKSPRPAIKPEKSAWMSGWMPVGPSNLRTLYGVGGAVYTSGSLFITWLNFGNIGDTSYCYALQTDGSIQQIEPATGGVTQVLTPGTILSPSSVMGFSQWGSQYIIFSKDQNNGYWLWDGTFVYSAGTLSPIVTIDNAGSNYDGSPVVIQFQTTGSGINVNFSAQVDNGSISQITVVDPGIGFGVGDFVSMNIRGGGSDAQAIAGLVSPTVNSGGISEIIVNLGGQGYTARASGVFTGGGGTGAVASLSITNGTITACAVVNPGTGYTSAPTFVVNDPGIPGGGGSAIPGGTGFSGFCNITFGQITAVPIVDGGTGYTSPPTVKIIGDGTNAAGIAQIVGGQVTDVIISNHGSGYTKALAVFEGGNNAASATPTLMPFGISGTAVEVYNNQVWVTNGAAVATFPPKNRTIFSDPNSPVGFSNGGGAFESTDSFLRVGYHWLKQTNGFLYLGGDSSVNYISGVQTTASTTNTSSVPVTTFGNQNVDPQIGSAWPSSVQVFSRNIVFANTVGVFVSYGGAVTKASLELDGFYSTGPIYDDTANFSSAVAQIFGIPVYILLLPIIDPISKQTQNSLLMWDGKRWFSSYQDRNLTYIATQEINSVMIAWGTDGTEIFPLFQQPSTGFNKLAQSKLFSDPDYYFTKTGIRLHGVIQVYDIDQPLTVTIDNENGLGTGNASITINPIASGMIVMNNLGQSIVVINGSGQTIVLGVPGIAVLGPYLVGQQGRMLGMTIQTTASDLTLMSLKTSAQVYTANI